MNTRLFLVDMLGEIEHQACRPPLKSTSITLKDLQFLLSQARFLVAIWFHLHPTQTSIEFTNWPMSAYRKHHTRRSSYSFGIPKHSHAKETQTNLGLCFILEQPRLVFCDKGNASFLTGLGMLFDVYDMSGLYNQCQTGKDKRLS